MLTRFGERDLDFFCGLGFFGDLARLDLGRLLTAAGVEPTTTSSSSFSFSNFVDDTVLAASSSSATTALSFFNTGFLVFGCFFSVFTVAAVSPDFSAGAGKASLDDEDVANAVYSG
jgi:hypothetical protein